MKDIRLDYFVNGVGAWWLTATHIVTGIVVEASGHGKEDLEEAQTIARMILSGDVGLVWSGGVS